MEMIVKNLISSVPPQEFGTFLPRYILLAYLSSAFFLLIGTSLTIRKLVVPVWLHDWTARLGVAFAILSAGFVFFLSRSSLPALLILVFFIVWLSTFFFLGRLLGLFFLSPGAPLIAGGIILMLILGFVLVNFTGPRKLRKEELRKIWTVIFGRPPDDDDKSWWWGRSIGDEVPSEGKKDTYWNENK